MTWRFLLKKNYKQVIFVIIAFFMMVMTSYFSISVIVRHHLNESAQEMLVTVEANIKERLREPEVTLVNSAFTIRDMIERGETQDSLLQYMIDLTDWLMLNEESISGFNGIYGFIRDEYLDGMRWVPPADYIPQERPWYIAGMEGKGEISATIPYIDAQTKSVIISFSQEMTDMNSKSLGILSLDVNVDKIAEYVVSLQLAEGGYGILLNQHLSIIAHPDDTWLNVPLTDISREYGAAANALQKDNKIHAMKIKDADGTPAVLFFHQLHNGWYVGLITPENSYYKDVYYTAFILSILGLILILILSYVLIRLNVDKWQSEEKSKQKSYFLAHMSHEIRTPMNAIIGMANIAKMSISDTDKCLSSINQIILSSHHLLGILNDILDMSKIESGKMELSNEPFNLLDIYREVSGIISQRCLENDIAFKTNEENVKDVNLLGDKLRLSQILINLLGNAVKFTGKKGMVGFSVRVLEENNEQIYLHFLVSDNGVGMTQEQINKLFVPFEQTDKTIAARYGGTGLGLSISQNLIKMMGSVIQVESKLNVGTQFSFLLAFKKSSVDVDVMEDSSELVNLAGKKILLVDDVEINRIIVNDILSSTEVEFEEAENGKCAVELFQQSAVGYYDLIFMDVQMPVMDGFEATRAIRALKREDAKKIPIIAMTANAYKEDVEEALAAGMNAHISKPVEIEMLMRVLLKYLPPYQRNC